MEIELKFQVPAAHRAALRRAVATASARTTRLQAVYADTAGQHLAAAGLALRLRKEGRVWVQTLKGRGDGLASRLEHEVRLPPQAGMPEIDAQRHAGTPVGAALAAALHNASTEGAALQPQYRTDIARLHRRVRFGGALIELAFDSGRLLAGERTAKVCEIEFELISGPPAALPALAQRWVQRFGLWWDVRTKSERGQRLALGTDSVPAVRAQAVVWGTEPGAETVWHAALQSALAHALPNAAEIADGRSTPEHLHQLRVGLRRLRTALRELAAWGGQIDEAQALQEAWRGPFTALGAARDADVQSAFAPQLQAAGAPPLTLPAAPSGPDPGDTVRGPEFNALMLRSLALMLQQPAPFAQPLPAAARELLRPAWQRLEHDAKAFAAAPVAQQHRTRKRLKRLRYVLEFLLPLYGRKPARKLLAAVGKALQALGDLNDLQTAEAAWRTQALIDPQAWFAVGWLGARHDQSTAAAARALARLKQAPRIWRA